MDWEQVLTKEVEKDYFTKIAQSVKERRKTSKVFPDPDNLLTAFKLTEFDKIKVVILGQDPYTQEGQANGLAFMVNEGIPHPKSLQNIQKEIIEDIYKANVQIKMDGKHLAQQGVFLLNSVLTVDEGKPGSHRNLGWEKFTDFIIKQISEQRNNVVFMLWGKYAQSKKAYIDSSRHLILEAPHPSSLSAYTGFFGCKHFSKANEYLSKHKIEPIIW